MKPHHRLWVALRALLARVAVIPLALWIWCRARAWPGRGPDGSAVLLHLVRWAARAARGRPLRRVFAGLGFAWRRRRILAWGGAAVAGAVLTVNLWVVAGTVRYRYERVGDVPVRQAAIVPGALVYPDGRPSDILADRLETALALYRAGRVARILVSGDHGRREYDEVNAMRRWLEARGVPSRDIFMDHAGFDTHDTMVRAREVFCVDSAVVVTQAFHLPRAVYAARGAGLRAVGLEADRRRYRKAVQNQVRESAARVKSFGEIHLGLSPRYLGPRIPIDGDGRATWDEAASVGAALPPA